VERRLSSPALVGGYFMADVGLSWPDEALRDSWPPGVHSNGHGQGTAADKKERGDHLQRAQDVPRY